MRSPLASLQHLIGYSRGVPIISPTQAIVPTAAAAKGLITDREEQAGY